MPEQQSHMKSPLSERITNTVKDLYGQPVQVIESYVEGVRGRYLNPFLFVGLTAVLLATVISFVISYPQIEVSPADPEQVEQLGEEFESYRAAELQEAIEVTAAIANTQFLGFLHFLLFPLLAVASMLFFRDTHQGFFRHLILNTYAVGQANVALLLLVPVWMIFGDQLMKPAVHLYPSAFLAGLVLLFIYNRYLFLESLTDWIKAFSALILGYFFYSLIAGFVVAIIAFLVYMALAVGGG